MDLAAVVVAREILHDDAGMVDSSELGHDRPFGSGAA
jgi:hypothetical protein